MVALRSQGNGRWEGPLGNPLGLVHWKRASSPVEAGWLDLLAIQGTLKSLLQHPVQKHQFFSTQLSSGPPCAGETSLSLSLFLEPSFMPQA